MKIIDVQVPTDEISIAPLGDIQYGNPGFSERAFEGAIKRLQAQPFPLYVIGTGDYIDAMSPSNRERYRASGLYDSTKRTIQSDSLEPMVRELHRRLQSLCFVVLCRGHHYFEYSWSDADRDALAARYPEGVPETSDTHLAALLGTKFAPSFALVNFRFQNGRTYRVLAWHGEGSGLMPSYGLNKLLKLAAGWEGLDAIFMGHTHRVGVLPDTRVSYSDAKSGLQERNIQLINSGSFLKAYLEQDVTYVERAGMNALALGHACMKVRPRREGWETEVTIFT